MNVFAYRLPFDSTCRIMECDDPIYGFQEDDAEYFMVHPFLPDSPILSFPLKRELDNIPFDIVNHNNTVETISETTKDEYLKYVSSIISFISQGKALKVVASRRKILNKTSCDISSLFASLCNVYPGAYVFFISSPLFGSWIGASPELLLKKNGETIETVALAGTRPIGNRNEWDEKNYVEQKIVTDFITQILEKFKLKYTVGKTITQNAGPVEHIMTSLRASISEGQIDIDSLLKALSPTPALSGYPVSEAITIINDNEKSPRELYGGFMGLKERNGDFRMNVILRCAKLMPDHIILYAGGGIVKDSDPYLEWIETERKLSTLLKLI